MNLGYMVKQACDFNLVDVNIIETTKDIDEVFEHLCDLKYKAYNEYLEMKSSE